MATTFPLFVALRGQDRGVGAMLGSTAVKLDTLGKQLKGLGKKLTVGVTLPVLGGAAAMFKVGSSLEDAMTRIDVLAGVSRDELSAIRDQSRSVGRDVGRAAADVARAQHELIQSGFGVADALRGIGSAARFSVLAEEGVVQSTERLREIMTGFQLPADQMGLTVRTVAGSALASATSIQALTQATRMASPTAIAFDQRLESTVALLATFQKAGIAGERAVSTFRVLLGKLAAPEGKGQAVLEQLGLGPDDLRDSEGRMLDVLDLMELLQGRGASDQQLLGLFGAEQGIDVIRALKEGVGEARRVMSEARGFDEAQAVVRIMEQGSGPTRRFTAALRDLANTFFASGLGQGMIWTVRQGTRLIGVMETIPRPMLAVAGVSLLVGSGIGPMVLGLGHLRLSFLLAKPLILSTALSLKSFAIALFTKAIPAVYSFTVALLTNPIGWISIAVAGAIGLLALLAHRFGWLAKMANLLKEAMPDWLVNFFGGGGSGGDVRASFGDVGLGPPSGVAGLLGSPGPGGRQSSETRVQVAFDNVPEGVRVAADSDADDLQVHTGLAMSTF